MNKLDTIKNLLYSVVLYIFGLFVKRDEKYLAFGSWCGELYIDNSRYLFEYAAKNLNDYKLIWIGNKELISKLPKQKNVILVQKDSFKSVLVLLKCKNMFCTQMHRPDLCSYNVYRGANIYSLDHGIPVKKWAQDAIDYNGEFDNLSFLKKIYYKIIGESYQYSYFITASPLHDKANTTALAYRGCTMEKNLSTGTPRNDMLVNFNKEYAIKIKKEYAELIGFDENKKVIMYLPTYRRKAKKIKSFTTLSENEKQKIDKVLEAHNAILIEKNHFVTEKRGISNTKSQSENIIKLEHKVDLQEMLLFTDIQISDYSGCFFDFILLDRPVIHYAYDYEDYKDIDSGLYYPIEDFAAGRVTASLDDTIDELEKLLNQEDNYKDKRKYVRNKYMEYEKGIASKQIIEHVLCQNNKLGKKDNV